MASKPKTARASWVTAFDKPAVRLGFALCALPLAYLFGSWAIDSGSLLDYAIALLLIVYGVHDLVTSTGYYVRKYRRP